MRHVSLALVPAYFLCSTQAQTTEKPLLKPYRVLVVVASWGDPSSHVITDKDAFQPVAALLKAWSVPFDILRLDQQAFAASYLFDRSGAPRYGSVLWLADLPSYAGKNLSVLAEAVHHGTSLLVACSRFSEIGWKLTAFTCPFCGPGGLF